MRLGNGTKKGFGSSIIDRIRWIAHRGARTGWQELSIRWKSMIVLRLMPRASARILAVHVALGLACGLVAVGFHGGLQTVSAWVGSWLQSLPVSEAMAILVVLPGISAWFAGVVLMRSRLPAAGSGIPQVKAALRGKLAYPGLSTGALKFFLCLVQIGGGASLGREGPTVQISASFVPRFLRIFALPATLVDRFIPVAAAAGIAAAFNTPMAAVTFVMEELMDGSSPMAMTGLVVAAAVAAIEEKLLLGGHPLFHVPYWGFEGLASIPSFLLLGICGGFAGVGFHRALLAARKMFSRLPAAVPVRMALGGVGAGTAAAVAWWTVGSRGIWGPGYALLEGSLGQNLTSGGALALLPLKFAATVSSYSSGGVGGIFSPVLAMGALLGEAIGHLQRGFAWSDATPIGAFALVGMGTFFASVIQAPITSVLIIFELTGDYGLVVPLMLANMTSFLVARRLNPVPVYDALLRQDGIDLHASSGRKRATVGEFCSRRFTLVAEGSRLEEIPFGESGPIVVVNATGRSLGILDPGFRTGDPGGRVTDRIRTTANLREGDAALQALSLMSQESIRWLPVVDSSGCPVGIFDATEALGRLSKTAQDAIDVV